MTHLLRILLVLGLIIGTGFTPMVTHAARPKYQFKIGTLAPEGSIWLQRFKEFTQEVREKTNHEVGFKIYPGGVMGDDKAMLRKMRVGQLHGGGFTMTGLGDTVPDFRVLGVPFLLETYDEVDAVLAGLEDTFRKRFAEKGLELLATTEVGFIYTMATKPIASIDDLRRTKSWVPSDDPISPIFLETLGITPISLSIPDVLASLQTGLIDTVYNSFYGSIVLQWFTRTRYVTDVPFGYAYSAFLLDKRSYERLPASHAKIIKEAAHKHFPNLLQDTRKSNEDALQVLLKDGVQLAAPQPGDLEKLQVFREETVMKVIDKAFSREIYEQTIQLLSAHRAAAQSVVTTP